jgi:3-oxoacyl-[acyl-carrier-protein] synthase-3
VASRIIGCGGYLPSTIKFNSDLTEFLDTSDEWIKARTGISQRHIASQAEFASHMAYEAAKKAISDAQIAVHDIDLLIVATTTPDESFPTVASKLHGYLGLNESAGAFDVNAVCAGFIYGLHIADSLLKSGLYRHVLFVAAEKMSSLIDWSDRSTAVLFGDGAGAVILKQDESELGIIDSRVYCNGSKYDILYTNGGVSSTQESGKIVMKGAEVFKLASLKMTESIRFLLQEHNLAVEDIAYIVPHQANVRIIQHLAHSLDVSFDRVFVTIEKHANCSAASIPLALAELKAAGKLRAGDNIIFTSFGAGAVWGSALVRW